MNDSRNAAIRRAHQDGVSDSELARVYDVSRQRIHQIVGRQEHSLDDRRRGFERQRDIARRQLSSLLAQRQALNAKIRAVLSDLRIAEEELGSMEVDALLQL